MISLDSMGLSQFFFSDECIEKIEKVNCNLMKQILYQYLKGNLKIILNKLITTYITTSDL